MVWECGPLPYSLYSVWSFALAWGDFFFFFLTPLLVRLSWPAAVRARAPARGCVPHTLGCMRRCLKLRRLPRSSLVFARFSTRFFTYVDLRGVSSLVRVFQCLRLGPTTNVYTATTNVPTPPPFPLLLQPRSLITILPLPSTVLLNTIKASPPGVCIVNQAQKKKKKMGDD